jgi:Flp pilus assembly protein TadG
MNARRNVWIRGGRCGASATELAILLPVVVVFTVGAVDLGRGAHLYQAVNNASRTGAQFAATQPVWEDSKEELAEETRATVLRELTQFHGYKANECSVNVDFVRRNDYSHDVTVTTEHKFHTTLTWPFIGNPTPIRSQVTMRRFR